VVLDLPETQGDLQPEDGPVEILHEDGRLLVCVKPPGLTVHPCPSCPSGTLIQRLLAHCPRLGDMPGQRPGIVHRLDKDTSGLLLVALDQECALRLVRAFAKRQIRKEYLALVDGRPPEEGSCDAPVGRHPTAKVRMAVVPVSHGGRSADTKWRRLWTSPDGGASLLRISIATGRTHQIRVHMSHLGHPILGDPLYAPGSVRDRARRLALHAWRLEFDHPFTGERLAFRSPMPDDILEAALEACETPTPIVIVGGPGSGKSTLLALLAERGLPAFSADECVTGLYGPGGEAATWLRDRLGEGLMGPDGSVDRRALFAAMNGDPLLRRDVETVVHGLVRDAVERFFREAFTGGASMAVAEIPLYLESGWRLAPEPVVVCVRCPGDVAERRLAESRGWDAERTATIAGWQWPAQRKEAACDILVDNDGDAGRLALEADRLLDRIRGMAESRRDALRAEIGALCRD
jgi:23S rRNA pseudouridine1911/1915/1917 synthase